MASAPTEMQSRCCERANGRGTFDRAHRSLITFLSVQAENDEIFRKPCVARAVGVLHDSVRLDRDRAVFFRFDPADEPNQTPRNGRSAPAGSSTSAWRICAAVRGNSAARRAEFALHGANEKHADRRRSAYVRGIIADHLVQGAARALLE